MARTLNIKSLVPRKDGPYKQGYYQLINPLKYIGDPTKIIFRSSWEKRFATYCDINTRVVVWSSEPMVIKYMHPLDGTLKSYNVDFYVKVDKGDGSFAEYLVEVKPQKQLKQPVRPLGRASEKKLLGYAAQMKTYLVNLAKFNAAKTYCVNRGWDFVIVTESFIF
jgi:hypothetical protein